MVDGYLVPKNDEYFNEYVSQSTDRLKFISNFSGSAGFAIILKNKNYLFVDGRYTIQGRIQSGKNFKIITIPQKLPRDILKTNKKIKIGFDPKLHSKKQINFLFNIKNIILKPINKNLIDLIGSGIILFFISSLIVRAISNISDGPAAQFAPGLVPADV